MDIFEADTIRQIVEYGPILVSNVPNHQAYTRLVLKGLLTETVVGGVPGYVTVTSDGINAYLHEYPYTHTAIRIQRYRDDINLNARR